MAALVNTAYAEHETGENDNGTEFHVVDDLYVGGWGGSINDPDVEIYGFSMFGSSGAYQTRYGDWAAFSAKAPLHSTGAVVILGNLAVGSTAYFHRGVEFADISTFTAGAYFPQYSTVTFVSGSSVTYGSAQNIYINDGATDQLLAKDSDGSLKWTSSSSLGDNLGNHIATKTLDMAGYDVIRIKEMSLGSSGSVKISTATTQFGGVGAGVLISTNAEVSGQLYVNQSATIVTDLTVNGNATIKGNVQLGDAITDNHTIYGSLQAGARDSNNKFMQMKDIDGSVVAYFRRK
jgi:hypothetical protein